VEALSSRLEALVVTNCNEGIVTAKPQRAESSTQSQNPPAKFQAKRRQQSPHSDLGMVTVPPGNSSGPLSWTLGVVLEWGALRQREG
jgi:hypothetical protein